MLPDTHDKHVVKYRARSGVEQFKPSLELAMNMDCDLQGFCLACGEIVDGVDPDTTKDACPGCGAYKLYGASELILRGLTFHAIKPAMKKPKLTKARLVARAYKMRVAVGLPHWYAMLNPLQDDGFGGTVCTKEEVNSFVYAFIYEGTDCGAPYYATGHA